LKTAGGSYLSANDPREVLGLGRSGKADILEVNWPDGTVDRFTEVKAGRYYSLAKGGKLE
jgi:hypothetical protein